MNARSGQYKALIHKLLDKIPVIKGLSRLCEKKLTEPEFKMHAGAALALHSTNVPNVQISYPLLGSISSFFLHQPPQKATISMVQTPRTVIRVTRLNFGKGLLFLVSGLLLIFHLFVSCARVFLSVQRHSCALHPQVSAEQKQTACKTRQREKPRAVEVGGMWGGGRAKEGLEDTHVIESCS